MSSDDKDLHPTPPENENAPEAPDVRDAPGDSDSGDNAGETGAEQPETPDATAPGDQASPDSPQDSHASTKEGVTQDAEDDPTASGASDTPEDAEQETAAGSEATASEREGSSDDAADQEEEASQAVASMGDSGGPPAPPQTPGDAPPSTDGGDDDPSLHDADEDDEDEEEEEDDQEQMTFLDHLSELRIRLTRIAIAVGVGFLACYGFSKQLFEFLMRPLVEVFPPDSKLIFTALPEAFFTYIKVAAVAGVLLTSPYIFYQIWSFVAPGLYDEERKYLVPIALFSGLFFAAGATFGYSVVFPFAFDFFMDFATETIQPMPSLKEYLSFSLKLLFAFGIIFELPLFIFFLARLGMVNAPMLRKFRKYAFLCSFVLSAVLTPPDVVSQTLMAGPLIILYELSIWIAHFFGKKPKESTAEEDDEADETEESDGDDLPAKGSET